MRDQSDIVGQVTEQMARVNARMAKVRHKVAVMSGKGGVGKSVVAANLALAFAIKDYRVGILDADLNGPAVGKMLGVEGLPWQIGHDGVRPVTSPLGIKVMSIDFLLPDEQTPVRWQGPKGSDFVWRGAMEQSAIREFLSDVDWGTLDLLLFDLAAGTHQLPNLAQLVPDLRGVVMVTIPSEISQRVVRKSMAFVREHGVPIIGLVENMSTLVCAECGHEIPLFNSSQPRPSLKGGRGKIAEDLKVPLLGKIPFDPKISQCSDKGIPLLMEHLNTPAGKAFMQIAERIEEYFQ